jgi:hypothetical protein
MRGPAAELVDSGRVQLTNDTAVSNANVDLKGTRSTLIKLPVAIHIKSNPPAAQALSISPLTGITKIKVVVNLSPGARVANLTEDRVRTIAELKLRLAGIRVLSDGEDRADTAINPYFVGGYARQLT